MMKNNIALLLLLSLVYYGCGNKAAPPVEADVFLPFNDEVTYLKAADIPEQMVIEATLLQAVTYQDIGGRHHALIYRHGPVADPKSEDEDALMASLQIGLYRNDGEELEWAYGVAESDCPLDLWVGLDTLTDLDKDGLAELSLVISRTCRGDVSPARMEVLIHENGETYHLTGYHWLPMYGEFPTSDSYALQTITDTTAYEIANEISPNWGRYTISEAPETWPGVLREYARKLWRQHVDERTFQSLSTED